jgi:hypothetical protein
MGSIDREAYRIRTIAPPTSGNPLYTPASAGRTSTRRWLRGHFPDQRYRFGPFLQLDPQQK